MSTSSYFSIGEVVRRLQTQYPDLTVSKVRFLEDKGLITPARTESGYRQFTSSDIERLETILRMQKLYFYPLSVIKNKLSASDRGEPLPELESFDEAATISATQVFEGKLQSLASVSEMLDVPVSFLRELGQYGLLNIEKGENGPVVDGGYLSFIKACWDLHDYGINPRHLRMYVTSADREAALISQAVMPQLKATSKDKRMQGKERLLELETLTATIKRFLFHVALDKELEGLD